MRLRRKRDLLLVTVKDIDEKQNASDQKTDMEPIYYNEAKHSSPQELKSLEKYMRVNSLTNIISLDEEAANADGVEVGLISEAKNLLTKQTKK